jgi:hypothetical protein
MRTRCVSFAAAVIGIVVVTRTLVYALAPSRTILAERLASGVGGPSLGVAAAIVGAGTAIACIALWLATIAVQERLALERRRVVAPPPIRPLAVAVRGGALFATAALVFALVESYEHERAGLGWHGLHCLLGPVHRDALPLIAALAAVAAALDAVVVHVLGWARRTTVALLARLPRSAARLEPALAFAPRRLRHAATHRSRGPPPLVVSVSTD